MQKYTVPYYIIPSSLSHLAFSTLALTLSATALHLPCAPPPADYNLDPLYPLFSFLSNPIILPLLPDLIMLAVISLLYTSISSAVVSLLYTSILSAVSIYYLLQLALLFSFIYSLL